MSNPNNEKGKRYERSLVRDFKKLGFDEAGTNRQHSRELDALGIDLWATPVLVQAKYGAQKNLNYRKEIARIKTLLKGKKYLKDMPLILAHSTDSRRETNDIFILTRKDFMKLIKQIYDQNYREQNAELYQSAFGLSDKQKEGRTTKRL